MYNESDPSSVEKYSSAVTLSDMEVFLFPELIYALTLANIMSPLIQSWANDSWFRNMRKMNAYRRTLRVKQFVMDNFTFNLDLDTWGLTTKQNELARFSSFVDETVLSQSNALFGYEGDKYYFDIDIRRHFGLDKYTSEVIPYWKTETAEAMQAFRYKPDYPTGAGECVSMATLYAAALFVTGKIPLEDIFLMATPLHSQNFVLVRDGVITNNRRIVTKNMWFNGTELSAKARRALQHERVTVVAHNTGYIHILYPEATISPESYHRFSSTLQTFLKTDIDYTIISNFLRENSKLQKCFQICHDCCGKPRYIEAEKVYAYEHGSKSRVGDTTQSALIHEIDEDEYYASPLENRIMLNEIESFFRENPVSLDNACNMGKLKGYLHHSYYNVEKVVSDLIAFCCITPALPDNGKQWKPTEPINLDPEWTGEQVMAYLESIRDTNETADLAFSAYRDLARSPWKPFLKAALERNPVSVEKTKGMTLEQTAAHLGTFENTSIYDSTRLAQPDEVWNFGRGDGLEKALCLVNIARSQQPDTECLLESDRETIVVKTGGKEFRFSSHKRLEPPKEQDFRFT